MTEHDKTRNAVQDWWQTAIIDMEPGRIGIRGYPIEQLIGSVSFVEMIWLMVRGELPAREQAKLLEAALVAAVDHGPQAPSIAIARMAMTCGGSVNNAMASAINVLDDVHGGAGQGALVVYCQISERMEQGEPLDTATDSVLRPMLDARQIMPGFGHRFHPIDPRTPRLIELATVARTHGQITGRFLDIAVSVESWLAAAKGKHLPMNIDGITAAIYGELGFDPTMARGLFIISRSIGILSHAYEQSQMGGRIKGPTPPSLGYRYTGEPKRTVPEQQ
ncbi:citryl-CoA lyase [Aureimonas fodinaquatilis]|uniref:citrate synthase (unknown stereospecificity) n=1 Tax=Aureimonas fodinaquatilis TaxID=2565783 RepID=A0A5B0DP32_9HYPH|nr:citryl-CoA lyase [Aureimonas fodinaquatilis]KAA0968216.1 citryl-CoA lyase [Aureimonas fodinaquatilis]